MEKHWLDIQHRGFSAYLKETAEDASCKRVARAIARANDASESMDTVLWDCKVETDWIEQIESALPFLEKAVGQDRQSILRQGETVPIEKAKRVSRASVEHLTKHSELVTTVPGSHEELRLDKIYTTENIGTYTVYENRFLYMLLRYLLDFVGQRYQKIVETTAAFSSKIAITKDLADKDRTIHFHLTYSETAQGTADGSSQSEAAIRRIESILHTTELLLRTELMEEVSLAPMLRPPITRTNVMLHDPNFIAAFELYRFLAEYARDGHEKLERYRYSGDLPQEMGDDLSSLVCLTSYLSYRCGGLREELEERFQAEERRRKEAADEASRERLAAMKGSLGQISAPVYGYILALEQRVSDLEAKGIRMDEEKALRIEAEARLEKAMEQIGSLQATATGLGADLRRKSEEVHALTLRSEGIQKAAEDQLRQAEAQLEEAQQRFAQELEQQKQEFLREHGALAEKYRLANARNRDLSPDAGDCCTKEAFGELEKEFEAFRRFYEKQWKLTKKQIRKEKLWDK
ncbi:MAG: hypothetical protein IJW45_01950 [Oscillospiraceae bacterium]|nr:hypothetical protein [Oscillospiraceae bacterium]